jgi:PAS domain S-box-containing protein
MQERRVRLAAATLDELIRLTGRIKPRSGTAYLIAASAVGLATIIRVLLAPLMTGAPFITFFPAMTCATFIGGLGVGLFSLGASLLCLLAFIFPIPFPGGAGVWGQVTPIVSFVVVSLIVVGLSSVLRDAADRASRLYESFNAVFEFNPDGVLLIDADGRITDGNQKAASMLGVTRDRLIGTSISSFVPERFRAHHNSHVASFLTAPRGRAMGAGLDLFALRADGTEFPVDVQIGPIAVPGGTRAIATIRDLTVHKALSAALDESRHQQVVLRERQRVSDELERSEARLRDFVDLSSDWLWEQDADLRLTWVSESTVNALYFAKARIGARRWEYQDTSLDPEGWAAHRADLEARRPFRDFQYKTIGPDGVTRYSSISGKPLFDANGTFIGYRGVGHRITERIEAERAILEEKERAERAEARLRDAIDSISEGVMIWDAEDRLVARNEIYRRSEPDLLKCFRVGETFETIMSDVAWSGLIPETVGHEDEWVAARLRFHRAASGSVERRLKGGRWTMVTERRMRDGGTVTLHVDITDRKEIELALLETQERFERAQAIAEIGTWEYDTDTDKWYMSR